MSPPTPEMHFIKKMVVTKSPLKDKEMIDQMTGLGSPMRPHYHNADEYFEA